MIAKSLLILPLLTFSFHAILKAQDNFRLNEDRFLSFSIGYSPSSVLFLGKTPDTQTTIVQFNYGRKLEKKFKSLPLYYLVSITPYITFDYPKRDQGGIRDIVTGFGFSPVGFEVRKILKNNLGLSLYTSGGFMLINKRFPTDKGKNLNFTYELSPQIFLALQKSLSFSLAYKFHHISNAQTGSENPGIDSNFIFFTTHLSI